MRAVVVPANELSEDLVARWAEIQQKNPALFSPFFRPEFTRAVAKVRDDVFVAIIDNGIAFFPFQRSSIGHGKPVGGPVSDYHGLIAASDFSCDPVALMRACGLRSWNFDHVPAPQAMFAPWRTIDTESPVVDLDQEESPGSTALYADHRRKRRRLEREVGQVEVELETTDPSMLEFCLKWKSAHYHRIGTPDLFARPWARSLMDVIASAPEAGVRWNAFGDARRRSADCSSFRTAVRQRLALLVSDLRSSIPSPLSGDAFAAGDDGRRSQARNQHDRFRKGR